MTKSDSTAASNPLVFELVNIEVLHAVEKKLWDQRPYQYRVSRNHFRNRFQPVLMIIWVDPLASKRTLWMGYHNQACKPMRLDSLISVTPAIRPAAIEENWPQCFACRGKRGDDLMTFLKNCSRHVLTFCPPREIRHLEHTRETVSPI